MNYYEVAILGASFMPLTYHCHCDIDPKNLVSVKLKNKNVKGVVLKSNEKPSFKTDEICEILNYKFSDFQSMLAEFISRYYVCEIGMVYDIFEPLDLKASLATAQFIAKKEPSLNQLQLGAKEFCLSNSTSVIFGDTGSGKSEVYFCLIARALASGKQALLLMPEISLTPQMTKRLEEYFGDSFGVWHSKISPKSKAKILSKFQNQEIKLIAGARSALFLPFTNLSLIIVDEEHDDSYKSSQKPRYNARDLAIYAANTAQIRVVLGSATPSLTTYKKQPVFRMKGTYFDTSKSFIYDESPTGLSKMIISQISSTLENKKQAIVLLPTRANFRYMRCAKCASIVLCPFCSVGMSLHKDKNALKCHYCGYMSSFKVACSACGSEVMEAKKMGTTELVNALSSNFGLARIVKFDKDEITTQKKLEKVLDEFNRGAIDILVGTQMLSKGHDYHNVDLAVIMGIDEHLGYSDFRAREKTLALAMQVAGRAGRKGVGRVLLQTLDREFFERYMAKFDLFLQEEMIFRQNLYPPFMRLLRILISHKNNQTADLIQNGCIEIIKNIPDVEIIGHGRAPIEFIASKFRYEILLRSHHHAPLIKAATQCFNRFDVQIDMDPINFN